MSDLLSFQFVDITDAVDTTNVGEPFWAVKNPVERCYGKICVVDRTDCSGGYSLCLGKEDHLHCEKSAVDTCGRTVWEVKNPVERSYGKICVVDRTACSGKYSLYRYLGKEDHLHCEKSAVGTPNVGEPFGR